jgi:hypothetical protein
MTTILGKNKIAYNCEFCKLLTNNKKDFKKHILTAKHLKATNGNNNIITVGDIWDNNLLACKCGKIYKHHSSLWKHKKGCNNINQPEIDDAENQMTEKELISYLLKENKEFKEIIIGQGNKMIEQSNIMIDLASKTNSTVNNNNINTNNNQFNMQFFLNETCKNAMSITEFVDSIEIKSEDLEVFGNQGYIQGISNIFIKGLRDLDETVRPIHCSDIKREILYIKDNDVWNKDENQQKIRNTIAMIAHKNLKYIPIWKEANPTSSDVTTKKNDLLMRIMNQVTTSITPDDDSGINKIIRNVASKVCINKKT